MNFLGNRHSYVENTRQIKIFFYIYLCTTCWKNFKHHLGLISNSAMRLKIMIQFISNHSIHNTTFLLIIFFQVFKFSICKVFLLLRFLAGPFSLKQWLSRQDRKKNRKGFFLDFFSMPSDFLSRANLVYDYVSWKNDSIISCNAECIICT